MRRVLAGLSVCAALASFAILAAVFRPVQLLVDINQAPTPISSNPMFLCDNGTTGYLSANDADEVFGLWSTDGTSAGTTRIATFGVAGEAWYIECLYATGPLTFFQLTDQAGVAELWRSDGTSAGTFRLLRQPSANDGPIYFMGQSGLYAFLANDGAHGNEIMVSDGTVAGTRMLVDLEPGPDGTWITNGQSVIANGLLYFAREGNLWVSDFTAGGTRAVTDFVIDPDLGANLDTIWGYRGGVLFRYQAGDQANSLYFSDGTGVGTTELLNLPQTPDYDAIGTISVRGDLALFTVWRYSNGTAQLWTTDGTVANTRHIPGPDGDLDPGSFFSLAGSRMAFQGWTAATGRELWISDGTDAGTYLLRDFSPGPDDSWVIVDHILPGNSYSVLRVVQSDGPRPIWITDGTQAGTRSVTDLDPSLAADTLDIQDAGLLGEDLYFWKFNSHSAGATQAYQLWRYTVATHQVQYRGSVTARDLSPAGMPMNRILLFTTNDTAVGSEPWSSDGSIAGTRLLANLAEERSNGSSDPGPYLTFGDVALFGATGSNGREGLWKSDGTSGGTTRLGNGAPIGSNIPYNVRHVRLGNQLLYGGKLAYDKWELWSTDGTTSHMVIDLSSDNLPYTGLWTSNPAACGVGFVTLNGSAYYGASPARVGTLYRTDGTEAGTQSLGRFPTSSRLFNPSSQVCVEAAYKNRVYFTAEDPVSGAQVLWRNDGTADGNTHVKTAAGRDLSVSPPMVEINAKLYFTASDGVQRGLWSSEGDPANTVLLLPDSALPEQTIGTIFAVGNTIYFTNCSGSTVVCRLYRTDGTVNGTFSLAVTDNDSWTQLAGNPVTFDGKLLFTGKSAEAGEEPWITDGTTAGTRMLRDIVGGTEGSSPSSAFRFNGLTYFYVSRLESGQIHKDLWRTDGTTANTERANLLPTGSIVFWENAGVVGQRVLLTAYGEDIGSELWMIENEAPMALPDTASTTSGTAVDVDAASNDTDPDGLIDAATLRIVQAPAQGTAVVSGGKLRYTPGGTFTGTATFTYAISDRQQRESAPATVTVTVTAPPVTNPPPTGGGNPPKSGGGGGRVDLLLIGLLGLLAASRRGPLRARGRTR